MKKMVIFIIFLLATTAMAATEPVTDKGQDIVEEKAQPVPAIKEEVQKKSLDGESWPRPFVPSEKIGADSVVSFPADI
jgi:hypothetical protein